MTAAQIRMANRILDHESVFNDAVVDMREIGSEGTVLRTKVPGPIRGEGSWLIARNGDAQSYDTGEVRPFNG